jgi:uncharacterized protein (TIGR03067 family)
MRVRWVLVLVVGLAAAAAGAKPVKQDDRDRLQGTWVSTAGPPIELTFTGNRWTAREKKENVELKGTFKLDPTKKPKTIDMTVEEGMEFQGKTSLGIYELDGDTLRWCANEPGKAERPKEFKREGNGQRFLLVTFKRVKKEP